MFHKINAVATEPANIATASLLGCLSGIKADPMSARPITAAPVPPVTEIAYVMIFMTCRNRPFYY